MNQTDTHQENQTLVIHYYLNDNSHSMNAFNRNAMEKDFLYLISEIGQTLNIGLKIESQAREEGGLKEIIGIVLTGVGIFSPAINNIATHYLTGQHKLQQLDLQIKEEELKIKQEQAKQSQIKTQKDELELKDLRGDFVNKLEDNHKIQRHLSNFYQKAQNYEKIEKIGYSTCNSPKEIIIDRSSFKDFVLSNKEDIEIDEEAIIEIISPVLDDGKHKWRGNYKGEKIEFSMADSKYKKKVIEGQQKFQNGSRIKCRMEIKKKYDEFGEEVGKPLYRVSHVDEIEIEGRMFPTESGVKQAKKISESRQKSLFDDEDSENGESQ